MTASDVTRSPGRRKRHSGKQRAGITIDAVVDTNVMLDIYSIGDLAGLYEEPGNDPTSLRSVFRRARSRESLLLAWCFHLRRLRTISLPDEVSRQLVRHAPPENLDTLNSQHVQLSIYLIKDMVLDGWADRVEPNCDLGLIGDACDDLLLDLAEKYGAPLITNEGYSHLGLSDTRGLRARAIARGIPVFAPFQFWEPRIGARSWRHFMARYRSKARRFLRRQDNSRAARSAIDLRRALFEHVFFGATQTQECLQVRLSRRHQEVDRRASAM